MNRISILILVAAVILPLCAYAQAPDILWTRSYGDTAAGYVEGAVGAVEAPDGGLAIVGAFVIQGYSTNLYVLRIDSNGDTLWSRTYEDLSFGQAICCTPDNGFLISGTIVTDVTNPYLIKIDSSGNELWSRSYSAWGEGTLRSIHPVGNGDYILAGFAMYEEPYNTNALLVRIDSTGDTLWSREYGGENEERAWSIWPSSDGGFITAAWTESYGSGGSDFYIIKTDSDGDSSWIGIYGDEGNDETREILQLDDGGYAFAGKTTGSTGSPNYYLMKIDQQGEPVWSRTYYFADEGHRVIHSFIRPQNGGFELTGYTLQDNIDILRTNDDGDSLWSIRFINDPVVRHKSCSIIQSQDESVYVVGHDGFDVWVVKLAPEVTGIEDDNTVLPDNITLHQNYPNPFNANTTISFDLSEPGNAVLSVYDLLGRRIAVLAEGYFGVGTHDIAFDASDLSSGVYFYNLKAGDISETKSMILLK